MISQDMKDEHSSASEKGTAVASSRGTAGQTCLYIDVLAILSAFAVVMLHANGVFWSHPAGRLWLTSNCIETLFYFAVPVFFMISGATLMDFRAKYSTKEYFVRRLVRAGIPFLAWKIGCVLALGNLPHDPIVSKETVSIFINESGIHPSSRSTGSFSRSS